MFPALARCGVKCCLFANSHLIRVQPLVLHPDKTFGFDYAPTPELGWGRQCFHLAIKPSIVTRNVGDGMLGTFYCFLLIFLWASYLYLRPAPRHPLALTLGVTRSLSHSPIHSLSQSVSHSISSSTRFCMHLLEAEKLTYGAHMVVKNLVL